MIVVSLQREKEPPPNLPEGRLRPPPNLPGGRLRPPPNLPEGRLSERLKRTLPSGELVGGLCFTLSPSGEPEGGLFINS